MSVLLLFIICALAACYEARSVPVVPPKHFFLIPRGCNDSDVLAVAGFALEDINKDRKDGYVLRLNRISDAREYKQQNELGSLYYLTLDVLETGCHVLSKTSWKDCEARWLHESVYGQCKALFFINKPERILYTHAYNCTLRPVSRRSIHQTCPDCPMPRSTDLSDPNVLEAATESLAKYNSENPQKQYSLVKITRATAQWVYSLGYFVEYLIRESTCTSSKATACTLQWVNPEPVGICKGQLVKGQTQLLTRERKNLVSVSCVFFESQAPSPDIENSAANQGPANLPEEKELQQENPVPPESTFKVEPKGSVQILPDLDDENTEDSQTAGPMDAFPVHLDLTTNPQGETLDISFLFNGPVKAVIDVLPFPGKERRSNECPGPAEKTDKLILPP